MHNRHWCTPRQSVRNPGKPSFLILSRIVRRFSIRARTRSSFQRSCIGVLRRRHGEFQATLDRHLYRYVRTRARRSGKFHVCFILIFFEIILTKRTTVSVERPQDHNKRLDELFLPPSSLDFQLNSTVQS